MKIIYGICFYFTKYKLSNLKEHIQWFDRCKESYPEYEFELCIVCMMDEKEKSVREGLINKIKEDIPISVTWLEDYNSGGTILGLDDCYTFYKEEKKDTVILFFEEDFHPTTEDFLRDSLAILPDYSYIGETTTGDIKICNRQYYAGEKTSREFGSEVEVWTDGGYYCSTIQKLDSIKAILGQFHIGDRNTKYSNSVTGITEGEVGFPTRLHYNGIKFKPLYRGKYFIHQQ